MRNWNVPYSKTCAGAFDLLGYDGGIRLSTVSYGFRMFPFEFSTYSMLITI